MAADPSLQVWPIPAFSDNYIWCIRDSQAAVLVDPGDAAPAIAYLEKHSLALTGILVTHHHADHTGGVKDVAAWARARGAECAVYGSLPLLL